MQTVGPNLIHTPKLVISAPPGPQHAGAAFAEVIGLLPTGSGPAATVAEQSVGDAAAPRPADDTATAVAHGGDDPAVVQADLAIILSPPFWPQMAPVVSPQQVAFADPSPQTAGPSSPDAIGDVAPDPIRNGDASAPSGVMPTAAGGAPRPVKGTTPLISDGMAEQTAPLMLAGNAEQTKTLADRPRDPAPIASATLPPDLRQIRPGLDAAVPPSATPPRPAEARIAVPSPVAVSGPYRTQAGDQAQQSPAKGGDQGSAGQGARLVVGQVASDTAAAASIPTVTARSYAYLQPSSAPDTVPAEDGITVPPAETAIGDPRDAPKDRAPIDHGNTLTIAKGHGVADTPVSDTKVTLFMPADWSAPLGPEGSIGTAFDTPLPILAGLPQSTTILMGAAPSQTTSMPALPQVVAAAFRDDPALQVELRLDPPELGSVRFRMDQSNTDLVVTILAERPDTLDLMRRHADQLLADLRQAGFQGASLNFGTSHGHGGQGMPQTEAPAPTLATEPPASFTTATPPPPHVFKGGLNLRL